MDTSKLQKLYNDNPAAKALLDELADRDRNQSETRTDRMVHLLRENEVKRADLIQVFRELEKLDVGRYVEGRRGWPSRFVWSVKSANAGRLARGEATEVENVQTEDAETEEADMLEHTFKLRADLDVTFSLPIDLTYAEAERLAGFVKVLPLEDYQ